jgi:hypothetical protein
MYLPVKSPINLWLHAAPSPSRVKGAERALRSVAQQPAACDVGIFSGDVPSAHRLHQQDVQSIETSTLHLALLGDMKRLNSLFCSVACSVMEQPDADDERDDY